MDFEDLYRMLFNQTDFVNRVKKSIKHEGIDTYDNTNNLVGLVGDLTIHLASNVSEKKYLKALHLLKIHVFEEEKLIIFLDNNFDLSRWS